LVAEPPPEPVPAAPAPVFGDFAEPEAARAAPEGLAELAAPGAEAAAAELPEVVSLAPALAPVSAAAVEPVVSGPGTTPADPPAGCWSSGLFPELFARAASALSRSSLRRFPQALVPAVITARRTATAMRWRRLRLADVFMDAMTSPFW
jgi:hypothetical protein